MLIFSYLVLFHLVTVDNTKDNYHTIERLLDRKSPLFRFPHDQLTSEQINWNSSNRLFEFLQENFDIMRLRLNVETLDEHYNTTPSYSQLFVQNQQQFGQSTENLMKSTNDNHTFTDLNLRLSKVNLRSKIPTFKIDYALVNRIELDWSILFTHLITRLKSSIIYHFVTLRFEFQESSSTSLTDIERLAVGKIIELLPSLSNEKQ